MRRKWLLLTALLISTGGVGVYWATRPHGPVATLGPHKRELRWVSYEDAFPKPVINFSPFGWGPFVWPRSPLPAGLLNLYTEVPDDPRIVAGYVVDEDAVRQNALSRSGPGWSDYPEPEVLAVPFGVSKASHEPTHFPGEWVDVELPYDPSALAARYDPAEIVAAGYRLRATYTPLIGSVREVSIEVSHGNSVPVFAGIETETGDTANGNFALQVEGILKPNGELVVRGTFRVGKLLGPLMNPHPFLIRIKPRP